MPWTFVPYSEDCCPCLNALRDQTSRRVQFHYWFQYRFRFINSEYFFHYYINSPIHQSLIRSYLQLDYWPLYIHSPGPLSLKVLLHDMGFIKLSPVHYNPAHYSLMVLLQIVLSYLSQLWSFCTIYIISFSCICWCNSDIDNSLSQLTALIKIKSRFTCKWNTWY
jgi:hypothetical protein